MKTLGEIWSEYLDTPLEMIRICGRSIEIPIPPPSPEERYKRAEEIYQERLKEKLEETYWGKIVAIEIESEDYFLGEDEVEAYEEAIKKYPDKTFCFLRVGYPATHFIGAF